MNSAASALAPASASATHVHGALVQRSCEQPRDLESPLVEARQWYGKSGTMEGRGPDGASRAAPAPNSIASDHILRRRLRRHHRRIGHRSHGGAMPKRRKSVCPLARAAPTEIRHTHTMPPPPCCAQCTCGRTHTAPGSSDDDSDMSVCEEVGSVFRAHELHTGSGWREGGWGRAGGRGTE